MPRRTRSYIGASLLLMFVSMIFVLESRRIRSSGRPALVVDATDCDFGEQYLQPDFKWNIPIQNTTGTDVRITSFRTSCECSSVEPDNLTIPANATTTVQLTIDLTAGGANDLSRPTRNFEVHVAPVVADHKNRRVMWKVAGTVRSSFAFFPRIIEFGEIVQGTASDPKIIEIMCHEPITKMEARATNDYVRVSVEETKRRNGFTIIMTAEPSMATGTFTGELILQAYNATGRLAPAVYVPYVGYLVSDILVLPARIDFGAIEEGSAPEATVVLTSRSKRQFTVTEILRPDSLLQITKIDAPPIQEKAFHLVLTNVSAGRQRHPLRFQVQYDDELQPVETLVMIDYYGLQRQRTMNE